MRASPISPLLASVVVAICLQLSVQNIWAQDIQTYQWPAARLAFQAPMGWQIKAQDNEQFYLGGTQMSLLVRKSMQDYYGAAEALWKTLEGQQKIDKVEERNIKVADRHVLLIGGLTAQGAATDWTFIVMGVENELAGGSLVFLWTVKDSREPSDELKEMLAILLRSITLG
ncbi:hypothetical protein [Eisenibacter elegans]|jgi:hypothetical protein|uniref:hypothetical protein n=1 Tax=Eisenibacter elegans TaxID=997 RepID=UPI00047A31A5|nr:hypothetical protein [Eisenibacter elegans]